MRSDALRIRPVICARTTDRIMGRKWWRPAGCSARLWKKVGADDPFLPPKPKRHEVEEERRAPAAADRFVRIDKVNDKKKKQAAGGGSDVPPWLAKLRRQAAKNKQQQPAPETSGETTEKKVPAWVTKMKEQAALRAEMELKKEQEKQAEAQRRAAEAAAVQNDRSKRTVPKVDRRQQGKRATARMSQQARRSTTQPTQPTQPTEGGVDRRPPKVDGVPRKDRGIWDQRRGARPAAGRSPREERDPPAKMLTPQERAARMAELKRGPGGPRQAHGKPSRMAAGRSHAVSDPKGTTELSIDERRAQMTALKASPGAKAEKPVATRMAAGRSPRQGKPGPQAELSLEERRAQMAALARGPGGASEAGPGTAGDAAAKPARPSALSGEKRRASLARATATGQAPPPEPAQTVRTPTAPPVSSGGSLDDLFAAGGDRPRLGRRKKAPAPVVTEAAPKPAPPEPKANAGSMDDLFAAPSEGRARLRPKRKKTTEEAAPTSPAAAGPPPPPVPPKPAEDEMEKRRKIMAEMRAKAKEEALALAAQSAAKDGRKLEVPAAPPEPSRNSTKPPKARRARTARRTAAGPVTTSTGPAPVDEVARRRELMERAKRGGPAPEPAKPTAAPGRAVSSADDIERRRAMMQRAKGGRAGGAVDDRLGSDPEGRQAKPRDKKPAFPTSSETPEEAKARRKVFLDKMRAAMKGKD